MQKGAGTKADAPLFPFRPETRQHWADEHCFDPATLRRLSANPRASRDVTARTMAACRKSLCGVRFNINGESWREFAYHAHRPARAAWSRVRRASGLSRWRAPPFSAGGAAVCPGPNAVEHPFGGRPALAHRIPSPAHLCYRGPAKQKQEGCRCIAKAISKRRLTRGH